MIETAGIKFSVVIPTRERAATLRHCLRSCLDQQFDNYEVIISDNQSSPATRAVVDEAASSKVRYVRTPAPLAMASNWDFGVSQARGEYVLVVGDDDGLLPHALKELDLLTHKTGAEVIRWDAAYYTWPSFTIPGQGNYLRLSLESGLREVDAFDVIREVIGFREIYTALPMLYNAAVHRNVLARLRAKTGRVFPHAIPDVYSGFAIAATVGRYLSTDVPMTVSGQSGSSNGIATLFQRGQTPIDQEFRDLNSKEDLLPDPRVPDLPAFPHVPIADAFLYAKKQFFPNRDIDLDRRQFVAGCVANLRVKDEKEWQWALGWLRDSLRDVPSLQTWFDNELALTPFQLITTRMRPEKLGYDGEYLHLDAATFGVVDVAGASQLCEWILNYRRDGISYVRQEMSSVKRANLELLQVCEDRLKLINLMADRLKQLEREGYLKRALNKAKKTVADLLGKLTKLTRLPGSLAGKHFR
jgi:glycosyltransferase involved in cell wall biosynthesis